MKITFGDFIFTKRMEKEISQTVVANNSSISRAHLFEIENNKSVPSIEVSRRILYAIGENFKSYQDFLDSEIKNKEH